MKKVHITKRFNAEVNGKLRTGAQWLDIEEWRDEQSRQDERERQEAAIESDMVLYNGYMVSSLYAEEMMRY